MEEKDMNAYREFLKDSVRTRIDFRATEQARGLPMPPLQKPLPAGAETIPLPGPDGFGGLGGLSVREAIGRRRSRRRYADAPLSLAELAYLLWATQGLREPGAGRPMFRTVPSAGARHALEPYVLVRDVTGLAPGLHRYLPLDHALLLLREGEDLPARMAEACLGQSFVARAAAVLAWTTIPHRMEWRYAEAAHRVIAMDAGHACQNLYLACEAIGAGTCAIAAFSQEGMDEFLGVDGEDEFTLYLAPVGRQLPDGDG